MRPNALVSGTKGPLRVTDHREKLDRMTDDHGRRQVWGDDPEEVDASAVVSEMPTAEADVTRPWHQHPAFMPIKAVGRFIRMSGRRIAVTIAGFAVLLAGVVLLVLPGPGWLLIFVGLAILATEYVWAQRLLKAAKRKAEQAKDAVLRKKAAKQPPTS
jgi:Flp pilus assembly protein TadB